MAGNKANLGKGNEQALLYRAFSEWIGSIPEKFRPDCVYRDEMKKLYEDAVKRLVSIPDINKMMPGEIKTVVLSYGGDVTNAGIFVTAFYNLIEPSDILFDIKPEKPMALVGYRLAKNKKLALEADTGQMTCYESEGDVINIKKSDDLGISARGKVANFGAVKHLWEGYPAVNCGLVEDFSASEGTNINFETVSGVDGGLGSVHGGYTSILINLGETGEIGHNQGHKEAVTIAIKNPEYKFWRRGDLNLSEEDCRHHPRLVAYFERLKEDVLKFRGMGFPGYFGVFGLFSDMETPEKMKVRINRLLDERFIPKKRNWCDDPNDPQWEWVEHIEGEGSKET